MTVRQKKGKSEMDFPFHFNTVLPYLMKAGVAGVCSRVLTTTFEESGTREPATFGASAETPLEEDVRTNSSSVFV